MKRALLLPFLLAASAGHGQGPADAPSAASAPASQRLTVDEAVERALAASARLARLGALEAAAAAELKAARSERWPQLDVGAAYQRRSEVPELAIFTPTNDPAQPVERVVVFPNIQDNWRLRAGMTLPLFTFGRIAGGIESAEQSQAAAGLDLRAGRADLVLETKAAYWSLVTARANASVLQDAVRAYEAHIKDARNRETYGLAPRSEVLAIEVERDRAELDGLKAEAQAQVAEANLRRLLDLPPATSIETVEPAAEPAPSPEELESLVAAAQAARPERQALVARVAAADAAVRSDHGGRLPQLGVSGEYLYANPNRDIVPPTSDWKDTWNLGIGVSWTVFDGGRRSAGEARARAQADAAREQLRDLDRSIRLEVTQQVLELRTAALRLRVAERAVASATESQRVAGERYRAGVIPSSELTDAEVAHERASLTHTEARAALRLAAAGLERAVGR
jgi:outer membrane protein